MKPLKKVNLRCCTIGEELEPPPSCNNLIQRCKLNITRWDSCNTCSLHRVQPSSRCSDGTWPRTKHVTARQIGFTERNNQVRQTVPHLHLPVFLLFLRPPEQHAPLALTLRWLYVCRRGAIWIRPDPFGFPPWAGGRLQKEAFYQRIKLRFIQGLCD